MMWLGHYANTSKVSTRNLAKSFQLSFTVIQSFQEKQRRVSSLLYSSYKLLLSFIIGSASTIRIPWCAIK